MIASILIFAYLLFITVSTVLRPYMIDLLVMLNFDGVNLEEAWPFILGLNFALLLIFFASAQIQNLQNIVFPNFVYNFLYKIFLPIVVLLSFYGMISNVAFGYSLLAFFYGAALILILFLISKAEFNLRPKKAFLTKKLSSEIRNFVGFSSLNSIGNILAFRLDIIMVAMMLGYKQTGAYGILMFLAALIEIPGRSVLQIAAPLVADKWNSNDVGGIKEIYTKSSNTLFSFGFYFFLGIWLCIDDLLQLTTNTQLLMGVKYVFFFLGIAKVIDLLTSVNTHIIIYSKYYKWNLIFVVLLGLLTICTNYYFIKAYLEVGAAMATALTLLVYNLVKLIFIYSKFGMQPFERNTFYLLILGLIGFGIAFLIPSFGNPILNILVKGSVFSICYLMPVYYYNLAPELKKLFLQNYQKIIKK